MRENWRGSASSGLPIEARRPPLLIEIGSAVKIRCYGEFSRCSVCSGDLVQRFGFASILAVGGWRQTPRFSKSAFLPAATSEVPAARRSNSSKIHPARNANRRTHPRRAGTENQQKSPNSNSVSRTPSTRSSTPISPPSSPRPRPRTRLPNSRPVFQQRPDLIGIRGTFRWSAKAAAAELTPIWSTTGEREAPGRFVRFRIAPSAIRLGQNLAPSAARRFRPPGPPRADDRR